MNIEESIVQRILNNDYQGKIVFEPDGNIPPDFTIEDRVAVEVRRLNQNFFQEDQVEGLEELSIPLFNAFYELLKSFGKQQSDSSYIVGICYRRLIRFDIFEIKNLITTKLQSFLDNEEQTFPYKLVITNEVELLIDKTKSKDKNLFRPVESDEDSDGEIISKYIKNIQYCIHEKSQKIMSYLSRYEEWWLYLVDRILLPLDENNVKEISKNIQDLGQFNQVSIISNGKISFTFDKNKFESKAH